jgi:biopolymer transport protein ExbD
MPRKKRANPEINSSSMADIAFLLLIFFLVTTTIANDKGLSMLLPPKPDEENKPEINIHERNIFKVLINSADRLLVEDEPLGDPKKIRQMVKDHVLNFGASPSFSDSPGDAVVSFKAARGTSYEIYITVLNEVQGAYYDMYADRAGVTNDRWREIASDLGDPEHRRIYDLARKDFPMQISIAEPSN